MYGKGLRPLSIAPWRCSPCRFPLVFFYAPLDADQGFIQKIFYLHVPLAITALVGFVIGGVFAIAHLRSGDRRWTPTLRLDSHVGDLRRRRPDHRSIWAKASWGTGGCGTSRPWSAS